MTDDRNSDRQPINGHRHPDPNRANSPEELAAKLGISLLALRVRCATGWLSGGPFDYSPLAYSEAEAGKWFGVSGRTIGTWKTKGMPWQPGDKEGTYRIHEIKRWLRQQDFYEPESRDFEKSVVEGLLAVVCTTIVQALHAEIEAGHELPQSLYDALATLLVEESDLRRFAREVL